MPLARGSRCRRHGQWTGCRSANTGVQALPTVEDRHAARAVLKEIADRTTGGRAALVAAQAVDQAAVVRASRRASRA